MLKIRDIFWQLLVVNGIKIVFDVETNHGVDVVYDDDHGIYYKNNDENVLAEENASTVHRYQRNKIQF
jgi:hypothetical protein